MALRLFLHAPTFRRAFLLHLQQAHPPLRYHVSLMSLLNGPKAKLRALLMRQDPAAGGVPDISRWPTIGQPPDLSQQRPKQYILPQNNWSSGDRGPHTRAAPSAATGQCRQPAGPTERTAGHDFAAPAHGAPVRRHCLLERTAKADCPGRPAGPDARGTPVPLPPASLPLPAGLCRSPSDAQLQALLAQMNQTQQQQPSLGPSQYPVQPQPQAWQIPTGLPPSLQAQLAQAREQQSRPYPQTLNSLGYQHQLQNPADTFPSNSINFSSMQPQQNGLTSAQYQGLLRGQTGQQQDQLEQLLRPGNGLHPGLGAAGFPSAGSRLNPTSVESLQAYLNNTAQPGSAYQGQNPHPVPGGASTGLSAANQLRLNNLMAQKPIPNPQGRSSSLLGGHMDYVPSNPAVPPELHAFQSQQRPQERQPVAPTDLNYLHQLLSASGKDVSLGHAAQAAAGAVPAIHTGAPQAALSGA